MEKFDIVVIGSGPGGYRAAVLAALRGARVAIVEKGAWGGCCLNRGCVPKKIWHHTADLVARSRGYGERAASRGRSAPILPRPGRISAASWNRCARATWTTCAAWASRRSRARLRCATRAPWPCRATMRVCSRPTASSSPPAPCRARARGRSAGFRQGAHHGHALRRAAAPGQARRYRGWRRGRGRVRLYPRHAGPRGALAHEPPAARTSPLYSRPARALLAEALRACGVAPVEGARVQAVEATASRVVLHLEDGRTETADWLLLGTGRVPCTEGLDLERAGVRCDARGFIEVNAYLQTATPSLYAIGDCVSAPMTANQALADATLAVSNILEGNRHERDPLWVPEVIYSAVVLARIGMSEDLAEEAGHEPAVGFSAFEASPAALGEDDARGFVRLLADMDSGELLGGEVAGTGADEIIHALCGVPDRAHALPWLARLRVNHPTRAEEFVNAVETLARQWGLTGRVFGR